MRSGHHRDHCDDRTKGFTRWLSHSRTIGQLAGDCSKKSARVFFLEASGLEQGAQGPFIAAMIDIVNLPPAWNADQLHTKQFGPCGVIELYDSVGLVGIDGRHMNIEGLDVPILSVDKRVTFPPASDSFRAKRSIFSGCRA